jgi:DNA-binding Lrp family transcriptional regulator
VIVCLTQDPRSRLRDVANRVGITERAVQRIVAELEEAGYITRRREGRQNRYEIHRNQPLRHVIEMHRTVGDLMDSVVR